MTKLSRHRFGHPNQESRERQNGITILGETIPLGYDRVSISKLRFLPDNPRIYAVTHRTPGFSDLTEEEQQEAIFLALCKEPSVKNLKEDVKRNRGLIESILVRTDSREVIEGNSRLAVYRLLREESEDELWDRIPCELISSITDEQQAAYLQKIHVMGKTQWTAYDKANFYVYLHGKGRSVEQIAKDYRESKSAVHRKIAVVNAMVENGDVEKRNHFSYYDVLLTEFSKKPEDARAHRDLEPLREALLTRIKEFGTDDKKNEFTALEMRKWLPRLKKKPRIAKKFIAGTITLEDAGELARETGVEVSIRRAFDTLNGIEKIAITNLDTGRFGAFVQLVRKVTREIGRIQKIVDGVRKR